MNHKYTFMRGLLLGAGLTGLSTTHATHPDDYFATYDAFEMNIAAASAEARSDHRISLILDGEAIDFELIPHSVRSHDYAAYEVTGDGDHRLETAAPDTYRAMLPNHGEARLLISEHALFGHVHRDGEWYFIEPMSRYDRAASPGALISYRQSDILPDAEAIAGLAPRFDVARSFDRSGGLSEGGKKSNAQYLLEIATEADGEFTQNNGGSAGSANAIIEGIVNELDGIYEANLGIQVRLTAQFASINPNTDPWNDTEFGYGPMRLGNFDPDPDNGECSTNTGPGVWEQFRSYWLTHRNHVRRDEAALFTGRDLKLCETADSEESNLFGAAGQLGSVCEFPNRSFLIMEHYVDVNPAGLLAHELGHAVGAQHDRATDCPGNADDPIMCGTVSRQQHTVFHPIAQCDQHAPEGPCRMH